MIKKHYGILVSILINILFLAGMAAFVGFYYELSDDWFMARNIVNGNYNLVFCSYFIQVLTGWVQKLIYPWNAFMILQVFFCFVSLTTIFYVFFDLFKFRKGFLFALLIECLFCVNFYSIITFTKTAAILATAGGVMMLWAYHSKKHVGYSIFGIVLIVLGSFYRLKIFWAVLAVFCFCILACFICKIKKPFWKSVRDIFKEIFTVKTIVLVFSMLVLVFSFDFASQKIILSDETMEYYREYNHLRSAVVDYPLPSYDSAEEEFQNIGISENDYTMLTKWYFDDQGYADIDTLNEIVSLQKTDKYSKDSIIECIKVMLYTEVGELRELSAEGIVMCVYLLLAAAIILLYKNKSWLYVGSITLAVGTLYIYLWLEGRIRFRAIISIWIAAVMCLLYIVRFLEYRGWVQKIRLHFSKLLCVCGTAAAVLFCGVILNHTATITPQEHHIINYEDYPNLYEYIISEEDKNFALSYTAYKFIRNSTVLEDPLYIGPDAVFDRCVYYGTPYYAHPSYNELLEKYGIDCLYTDIVDNEDFYFIDRKNSDIEMMMAYLSEQYPENGPYGCRLITVLDQHCIYKIYTVTQ